MTREQFNAKMDDFLTLEFNWDGYGAFAIDKESVEAAREIGNMRYELGKDVYWAVPTVVGMVVLEWYNGDDKVRFRVVTKTPTPTIMNS